MVRLAAVEERTQISACKGLFFRYEENDYWSKKKSRVVISNTLTLLKRNSCNGCPECSWILEELAEEDNLRDLLDTRRAKDYGKCEVTVRADAQDDYTLVLVPC